jgi:hypothetical protein
MKRTILIILGLLLAITASGLVFAKTSEPHFYRNIGMSKTDEASDREPVWVTQSGYHYTLNPTLKLDIGYAETASYHDFSLFDEPLALDILAQDYYELFGAAKLQHNVFDLAWIYAKGGLSLTEYRQDSLTSAIFSDQIGPSRQLMSYFSVGAKIPALKQPDLDLNMEIIYQDLELDTVSEPTFLFGAQYRF